MRQTLKQQLTQFLEHMNYSMVAILKALSKVAVLRSRGKNETGIFEESVYSI